MKSYGDPVRTMAIVSRNRASFMLEVSSSEVPGASYARAKSRREPPESGTHAKRRFYTDTSNRVRYYTHCVRLEKTNNFRFWINPVGGLYKKLRAKKETKKKIKE